MDLRRKQRKKPNNRITAMPLVRRVRKRSSNSQGTLGPYATVFSDNVSSWCHNFGVVMLKIDLRRSFCGRGHRFKGYPRIFCKAPLISGKRKRKPLSSNLLGLTFCPSKRTDPNSPRIIFMANAGTAGIKVAFPKASPMAFVNSRFLTGFGEVQLIGPAISCFSKRNR